MTIRELKPTGFDAASADWDEVYAGRPYTLEDWNSLTFGEQQRYGAQDCKTKGAVYQTKITGQQMQVTVSMPTSLIGCGFTEAEARWLEAALHKKVEETIHFILVRRSIARKES